MTRSELVLWWALLLSAGLSLAAWAMTVPWPAAAQHPGHDWYQWLKTPQGYSCCNGDTAGKRGDCRPVQARPTDDGGWEAYFGGRWQPVPQERVLPGHLNREPLQSHICEQDGYIRCRMLPTRKSCGKGRFDGLAKSRLRLVNGDAGLNHDEPLAVLHDLARPPTASLAPRGLDHGGGYCQRPCLGEGALVRHPASPSLPRVL